MSDRFKTETYNTLTAMGYSYAVVDKAYKASEDKTTDGVINYIFSNPDSTHRGGDDQYNSNQSRPQSSQSKTQNLQADLELSGQLLLMGYDDYLIEACLQQINEYKTVESCINWIENNMHKIKPPTKAAPTKTQISAREPAYGSNSSKNHPVQAQPQKVYSQSTRTPVQVPVSKVQATKIIPARIGQPTISRTSSGTQPAPILNRSPQRSQVQPSHNRLPSGSQQSAPAQVKPVASVKQEPSRVQGSNTTAARPPTNTLSAQNARTPTTAYNGRMPEQDMPVQQQQQLHKPVHQPTNPNPVPALRSPYSGASMEEEQPITQTTANFTKSKYQHYEPKQIVVRDDHIKVNKKSEEQIKKEQEIEAERLRREILAKAQLREIENQKQQRLEKRAPQLNAAKAEKDEADVRVPQIEPVESLTPPPGLSKGEKDKWMKEQQKKQILKQIAIDRAIKNRTQVVLEDESQKELTIEDKFKDLFEKMEKCYPNRTPQAAQLAKCLETIGIYLSKKIMPFYIFNGIDNILSNPSDQKFRIINLENKAFQNRVKSCIGGIQMLKAVGFSESRGQLSLGRVTKADLEEWCRLIKLYLEDKVIVVNSN